MFRKYRDNRGATAIEYGIIAAGIAIVIISGLTLTGTNTKQTFCTIASAIGTGSGTCSGSSSSGSRSSSSGSSSGMTEEQLEALNASLGGKLDMIYVPESLGGKNYADPAGLWGNKWAAQDDIKQLEAINASDPITNVFGVFDTNKQPITNYQDVIAGLETATSNSYTNFDSDQIGGLKNSDVSQTTIYGSNTNNSGLEVTTQSGKIYNISYQYAKLIN